MPGTWGHTDAMLAIDVHDHLTQTEERLERYLVQRIRPAIHAAAVALEISRWDAGETLPAAAALAADYRQASVGDRWGAPWSTTWFRLCGEVPAAWAGRRVEAVVELTDPDGWPGFQAEALVYDRDATPVKGLHPRNGYVPVAARAGGGEPVELYVEAAANPRILDDWFTPTALGDPGTAGSEPLYRLRRAELAIVDEAVLHLAIDLEVVRDLAAGLPTADPRRHELRRGIDAALDALDPGDIGDTALAARAVLAPLLARPATASAHRVSAVGHAHIDTAWLWPLRETIRKCSRSFANVLALVDEYPEVVFACSQAQHYAWIEEHQPALFDGIRAAVADGRWVPVGGMWVEPDAILPGGESLARQLLHGQRYFRDRFGATCDELWIPDSFGYSPALPQLARLAGIGRFLTQKLSWNHTNRFPHSTLWWEGLDGSRVFTHFPPVETYNAEVTGEELLASVATFADKGVASRSLLPFGFGDGGGGPTREMLERARRFADLEGAPRVTVEAPSAFFAAAEAEYPDAPVWAGELYLESHRGTFTTQVGTKQGNRHSEALLREAELWAATAAIHAGFEYPYDALDRIWKTALTHQFHDILPGSSIAWVHREAEATYATIAAELEAVIADALRALTGDGDVAWQCNPSPFGAAGVAAFGLARAGDAGNLPVDTVSVGERHLANGLVEVELDDDGLIRSLRDLSANRELVPPGARANLLQLHVDTPTRFDAWDIDPDAARRGTDITGCDAISVAECGPQVGALRVERAFGSSRVVQTIRVRARTAAVEIDTAIEWRESERLLKLALPLDLRAEHHTAEVQFGHVARPIHTNTSWDAARYEVQAQRWVHVTEGGYGVALVTPTTFGYDASRTTRPGGWTTTTLRASLVRAPRSPDPDADRGRHRFRHLIVPGATLADAIAAGYAATLPVRELAGAAGEPVPPLVSVDRPAVVVEAVKLAEDRSGDVIVRCYESLGGRATATLRAGFEVATARFVDLLEDPIRDLPIGGSADSPQIQLTLRPFEIVTVRLARGLTTPG